LERNKKANKHPKYFLGKDPILGVSHKKLYFCLSKSKRELSNLDRV